MSVIHLSFLDEEPETGSPLKRPHTHLSHPSPQPGLPVYLPREEKLLISIFVSNFVMYK